MARPAGGWVSGYTAPTLVAARGVWSMRDHFNAARATSWPFGPGVNLSLHFNGFNSSTTIVDSSRLATSGITCVSQAALSTAVVKFGTASLYVPDALSRVNVPGSVAFNLGTNDFTIELWIYPTALTAGGFFNLGPASTYGVAIYETSAGNLHYYLSSNGSSWNIASAVSIGRIFQDAWHHVALVRSGATFSPYLNGVRGTVTTSSATITPGNNIVTVGYPLNVSRAAFYDDVRVTFGQALYSGASFTPPSAELTP